MNSKIFILLPVHNRREKTAQFIDKLKDQTYQKFHLVLIDDGSTDGTAEMVQEQISSCTVIRGRGDWWWAGSLQQGYDWLRSHDTPLNDMVLIINDDTEIGPDFLEKGKTILEQQEGTLLLAQAYDLHSGRLTDVGVRSNWKRITFTQAESQEEIDCLSTRGLFLRVGDFFRIGGFYPALLPHYLSDYEFTIRAHRKGLRLITDPSLKIWVDEEATGYRVIEKRSLIAHLKKNFSRKSMSNPLAWTYFIALACPWPWKVTGWIIVWKRSLCQTFQDVYGRPAA